jgi:hypothetical protein
MKPNANSSGANNSSLNIRQYPLWNGEDEIKPQAEGLGLRHILVPFS